MSIHLVISMKWLNAKTFQLGNHVKSHLPPNYRQYLSVWADLFVLGLVEGPKLSNQPSLSYRHTRGTNDEEHQCNWVATGVVEILHVGSTHPSMSLIENSNWLGTCSLPVCSYLFLIMILPPTTRLRLPLFLYRIDHRWPTQTPCRRTEPTGTWDKTFNILPHVLEFFSPATLLVSYSFNEPNL